MTREQTEADVREILASGAGAVPIEGSQWTMDWELSPADREKAGVTADSAPALRKDWAAKLDGFEDHRDTSSTSA